MHEIKQAMEEEEHSSNVSFVDMEDIERKAFCSGRCHWQIWRKHMILPAYCTRCPKSSLFVLVSVYNILDPNGCCYPTTVWPLFNSSSSMLSILNFSILLLELCAVLSLRFPAVVRAYRESSHSYEWGSPYLRVWTEIEVVQVDTICVNFEKKLLMFLTKDSGGA